MLECNRKTIQDKADDTTAFDQTAMIPNNVWMWVTQKKLHCFSLM